MFAIIKSGGRQVKVTPGAIVTLDRIESEPGSEVTTDQVSSKRLFASPILA